MKDSLFKKIGRIFINKYSPKTNKEILQLNERIKNPEDKIVVGLVDIYKNNNLIERTHNLVVYNGREYLASKSFNLGDYKDWNITHFAVGSGGTDSNDPTVKNGPEDNDTDLYHPLTLNKNNPHYLNDGKLKPIDSNNIQILTDSNTENHRTLVQVKLEIIANQEPDLQLPAKINEAGLYYTKDNNFRLFAHTTFLDKYLEENDTLTIIWRLFF